MCVHRHVSDTHFHKMCAQALSWMVPLHGKGLEERAEVPLRLAAGKEAQKENHG